MQQELFEDYLPKKIEQIESLLQRFDEDTVELDIRVEKFDKHDAFEVEFVLKIPMRTITAKEASHAITKAVDLSKDRLVSQLKKFQKHVRTDQLTARKHASIRKPEIHEAQELEKSVKEFLKV